MIQSRRLIGTAVFLVLIAATGTHAAAAAEDLPAVEAVLDGYVQATGGLAAYDKITNRVTKAKFELAAQGIVIDTTIYLASPNKVYTVLESEAMGKVERGTDGQVVWEISTMMGPQIKEGQEKTDFLREARLDKLAHWRDVYSSVEIVGIETVDGKPSYKVVGTPADGKAQTLYFDQTSKLLVKLELVIENPMGTIPMASYLSDYREVDGIQLPHKTRIEVMGQERLVTIQSVEHNVDLPADRFAIPVEIRALLEKKQGEVVEHVE